MVKLLLVRYEKTTAATFICRKIEWYNCGKGKHCGNFASANSELQVVIVVDDCPRTSRFAVVYLTTAVVAVVRTVDVQAVQVLGNDSSHVEEQLMKTGRLLLLSKVNAF